jgi:hypothetical protein
MRYAGKGGRIRGCSRGVTTRIADSKNVGATAMLGGWLASKLFHIYGMREFLHLCT